jgi:hypothetical protein
MISETKREMMVVLRDFTPKSVVYSEVLKEPTVSVFSVTEFDAGGY